MNDIYRQIEELPGCDEYEHIINDMAATYAAQLEIDLADLPF